MAAVTFLCDIQDEAGEGVRIGYKLWLLTQVQLYPVIPVAKEKLVDTNGAGDAFVGGEAERPVMISVTMPVRAGASRRLHCDALQHSSRDSRCAYSSIQGLPDARRMQLGGPEACSAQEFSNCVGSGVSCLRAHIPGVNADVCVQAS